jgi:ubiquinone/menaquinone biosynthesis C-methylase UbiE
MGFYENQILPRIIDVVCGLKMVHKERHKTVEGVHGRVLEVGFGSGLNLPHYTNAVERLVALDPSEVGKKLAEPRMERAEFPIEHLALKGEDIPAEDASFDSVVTTFTLCTIPDAPRALAQMRRVLKPGGKLYFCEHGSAPDPEVRKWQERFNGFQQLAFGGCHLNRKIDELVMGAGFQIEKLETYYVPATPKVVGFLYRGCATPLSR